MTDVNFLTNRMQAYSKYHLILSDSTIAKIEETGITVVDICF